MIFDEATYSEIDYDPNEQFLLRVNEAPPLHRGVSWADPCDELQGEARSNPILGEERQAVPDSRNVACPRFLFDPAAIPQIN